MRANRVLKMAVAYTLAAASSLALAQAPAPSTITELETVIVTGSYIKGTAEDAALPVDVITSEDLQKQGSPSMVELVKAIPAVQATLGESNQFGSAASAGSSSINLRGLGATRTLVLLNGRRLANAPSGIGVDVNLLPSAAIERIEVLKDGAAATYGSDAIAGVVNFITKKNFEGLSVGGSYTHIKDSDGDYDANVAWGWQGDSSSALVAVGYRHRSELRVIDRDWAVKPFASNTLGGWSSGSVTYQTDPLVTATRFRDPACVGFGGAVTTATNCFFQFSPYDNLVEKEDHYQIYAEFNQDLFGSVKLHTEALYAVHDVPEEAVSPSYSPTQGPTPTQAYYFIPYITGNAAASNPGLTALLPSLTAGQQTAIAAAGGVYTTVGAWRPFSFGGNPVTGREQKNSRKFDGLRLSVGLSGEITSDINWDTAVTYMENGSELETPDALVSRLDLALRGLGGPNCNVAANTPGVNGCLWLNPFSTGIAQTGATGVANPLGNYNAASAAGNAAAMDWLTVPNRVESTTKLLVVDAVLTGELGFIQLPGGPMGWAAGVQYRDSNFIREVSDFSDVGVNPCPQLGNTSCAVQTGALSFYGPLSDQDLGQEIFAGFAEFSLPILDSLQAQLAVRYEDYGGEVGSTTNPKLALRWQPIDWLTLRGSAGTTFRGPVQSTLAPGNTTALLNNYGTFKAFDTAGNPQLTPESADTYNLGFIVKAGGFGASVDYWNFVFKEALTAENGLQVTQAFFGPATTAAPGGTFGATRCGNPTYAALQARFTFGSGVCGDGTTLIRTQLYNINATSDVEIDGVDASAYYIFSDIIGGDLTLGADGTYNLHYKLGANYIEGILIDAPQDGIGTRGGRGGPQPQWKGAAYIDYSMGDHNLRTTVRYVASMTDLQQTALANGTPGKVVGSFRTYDVAYVAKLLHETTVSVSVINVTDEDPPFARLTLNYEPFIGNPVGRYFKVGVSTKF